jgi:hypothetical protein
VRTPEAERGVVSAAGRAVLEWIFALAPRFLMEYGTLCLGPSAASTSCICMHHACERDRELDARCITLSTL